MPEEEFIAPFSIPTAIPRFYFAFRKPIQLQREDLKTEGRCDELYKQVTSPYCLICDCFSGMHRPNVLEWRAEVEIMVLCGL